jgi:hypothetical protein
MEWIDLKHRLPNANKNVLVNIKIIKHNVNYVSIAYYEPFDDAWYDEFHNKITYESKVTYWQPLPKAHK